MADEPSGAELSPEEAYRSIGRYVYEFSQLLAHMRAAMTRYLDASPQGVADIAFAQSSPEQIAIAFFAMCRTVTRLEMSEEKAAARLTARVGEAIEMRGSVAHSDWWVGSSGLGAEAVQRSALDLDARSESLVALTNLIAEYGALCLHQPPYDRGEHHVGEYIVMRAGEAVREGPKALASPRVFYAPPPLGSAAGDRTIALTAQTTASQPADEQPTDEPPPRAGEVQAAPEPAQAPPTEPELTPPPPPVRRESLRRRVAHGGAVLTSALRAGPGRRRTPTSSEGVPSVVGKFTWLTHQRLRRGMLAIAGISALLLALVAYAINAFGPIELSSLGTRFSIRGTQTPPSDVVLVAIDNQSTTGAMPLFPYPRRYEASVISRIYAGHPKAIGVDIQFTNATDATDDNDLINAVSHAPGVVLSTSAVHSSGSTSIFGYSAAQLKRSFGAIASNAFVSPTPSAALTTVTYEQDQLKTFAVALASEATGHAVPLRDFPAVSGPGACSEPAGRVCRDALVDFAGPPGVPFAPATRSFADVCTKPLTGCSGSVPSSFFKGKIVLVGATAPVLHDVYATPAGPLMPGVEYWANALWSILRGSPLRDASGALNVAMIVLLSLLMPLIAMWLRPGRLTVVTALAIGLAYLVAAQLEFNGGTVMSVVYPLVGLALGGVEATTADLWAERIHRRQLEVYKAAYERLPSAASAAFFISYRREQSSWPARILRDELVRRFGEEQVFKDSDSIDAGQQWPAQLESAVGNASVVLVLIGPQWADARDRDGHRRLHDPGDWVRLEVETALAHTEAAVVPVLVDGAAMPAPEVLPDTLRPLTAHQAFALSVERWNADLEALIASIHSGRIRDFLASERAAGAGGTVGREQS